MTNMLNEWRTKRLLVRKKIGFLKQGELLCFLWIGKH